MKTFSHQIGIPISHIDFAFWYMQEKVHFQINI